MKKKEHLPIFGVGPLIVSFQIAVTLLGIVLSRFEYFEFGEIAVLNIPLKIVGAGLILFGVCLYLAAAFHSKVYDGITHNKLVKTGVYGIVRNPIYSAFLLACTGAVCLTNNLVLFVAPVLGWAFMTIVLKLSEEKWLKNLYGNEYVMYCKRVNRCIPWFAKK
ncbi:MAG: isoprenylcysteine carboxylmethyltransferase family protein [Ruminococcus sp.]|nr:isoprenylcysteine carboxylmethyltransferase family protein [Ruminococcus sp.]